VRAQPRAAARLGAENSKSSGERSAAVVPRGRLLKTAEGLQIVKPRLLSGHRGEIQVRKQIIDRLFRELHVILRFRVTRSSPWFLGNLTWACASTVDWRKVRTVGDHQTHNNQANRSATNAVIQNTPSRSIWIALIRESQFRIPTIPIATAAINSMS
jgi:hypothetical protein